MGSASNGREGLSSDILFLLSEYTGNFSSSVLNVLHPGTMSAYWKPKLANAFTICCGCPCCGAPCPGIIYTDSRLRSATTK